MTAAEIIALVHERDGLVARIAEIDLALGAAVAPAAPARAQEEANCVAEQERQTTPVIRRNREPTLTGYVQVFRGRARAYWRDCGVKKYIGIFDTRAEADAAIDATIAARAAGKPLPSYRKPGSGTIQKLNGGWRWKAPRQGKYSCGPTVPTREEAEIGFDVFAASAPPAMKPGRKTSPTQVAESPPPATVAAAEPEPVEALLVAAPPEPPPPPAPARRQRTCKKCGGKGHIAKTCRGDMSVPGDDTPAPPGDVQAGQRFIVVEDFEDEDSGARLAAGDVWEAVASTGQELDGAPAWTLLGPGGELRDEFPTLHPFLPQARPGFNVETITLPRIGMGTGARALSEAA